MSPKLKGTKPGAHHETGPGGLSAEKFAHWYRQEALANWKSLDVDAVAALAELVSNVHENGGTIYVMGNGGSAATASHWAVDLSKTAATKGKRPLKVVCLNDNVPALTAIANDVSFDEVFSRQIETLVEPGDCVILISGSGNSPNLLAACDAARRVDAPVAALLGFDGGKLKSKVDVSVHVLSDQYGVIEDMHMAVGHMLTFWLKQRRA